jgi:hypothetical protein
MFMFSLRNRVSPPAKGEVEGVLNDLTKLGRTFPIPLVDIVDRQDRKPCREERGTAAA